VLCGVLGGTTGDNGESFSSPWPLLVFLSFRPNMDAIDGIEFKLIFLDVRLGFAPAVLGRSTEGDAGGNNGGAGCVCV